jgi:cell wall-associated NlpC family hydrolase
MNISRIYYTLSSAVVVVIITLVALANSLPTTAHAATTAYKNDTSTVKPPVEIFVNESVADKIIALGESFIGKPYHYTGKTPKTGFDCSGFTHYVFGQFGIELSPASKEQIFAGEQVSLADVRKGDLLVFTGTNLSVRQPGHVGIVITEKGERPVKFVHSSSNGGVKISQVDSTRYQLRLLQVRRLLK